MQIVLVRHAQPDWEPGGFAVDDPSLTPLGHAQAECLAEALASESFDAIYISPLLRVTQTAAPLLREFNQQAENLAWLREMPMPTLEGKRSEQVREYFKKARNRELAQWWEGNPGAECFQDFYDRVRNGLEHLLMDRHALTIEPDVHAPLWQIPNPKQRILLIAHEGTNAVLIAHLLGLAPRPWIHRQLSSHWAAISRLHSTRVGSGHIWSLECFNRITHLESLHALEALQAE